MITISDLICPQTPTQWKWESVTNQRTDMTGVGAIDAYAEMKDHIY